MRDRALAGRARRGVLVAVVLLLAAQSSAAGVITVEGDCTLVDAITAANTDAPAGSCPAGSGADEIHLTGDVELSEVDNQTNGDNGLPSVTSLVTLVGNGFTIERLDGAPPFRLLHVGNTGALELVDLVATNGSSDRGAGAFVSPLGVLTLTGATLTANHATDVGGGVFADGNVVIRSGSLVAGNSAEDGGGIGTPIGGGSVTVLDSEVSGNVAGNEGGGIRTATFAEGVTITDSTFSDNRAFFGGGVSIINGIGDLNVTNSTFSGNSALDRGGAILCSTDDVGGAILNSTFSGNSAVDFGGALHIAECVLDIRHSTLSGNAASLGGGLATAPAVASVVLTGTIVANSPSGGNCLGDLIGDGGSNFDDDGTCPGALPITPAVDFDTVLADNGGPTPTHALLAGSVAADAAGACGLATDQRLFARDDGSCDSGSFELGGTPPGVRSSVTGMTLRHVFCVNATTGQSGTAEAEPGVPDWTCEQLGVATGPGDRLQLAASGQADGTAAVGGSVSGFPAPLGYRVDCRNLTTAQTVGFATAAVAWDCEAEGLIVTAGDRLWQGVRGELESEVTFEEHVLSSEAGVSVVGADLDGDGDTDVIAGSDSGEEITWFENDGGERPAFTTRTFTTSADEVSCLQAADMDGDTDVDLVLASTGDDKILWFLNTGGSPPVLAELVISTDVDGPRSVYPADVDGDGDTDVVTASSTDSTIAWFENDGTEVPGFTKRVIASALFADSAFAADMDGDGDIDVLSGSAGGQPVRWYENDGGAPPTFTPREIPTQFGEADSVHATDVDGDGDTDVVVAFNPSPVGDAIAWFDNDGATPPQFVERTISTDVNQPRAVFAADLDGDGDTDVLSASQGDDTIAWYENDGEAVPAFTQRALSTTANFARSVHAADADGDGDTDALGGWLFGVAWYEQLVDGAGPEL